MASRILIVAVFFLIVSDVFISFMAADDYFIGDNLNCLSVKSKYTPFKGQNTVWKSSLEKEFTDQEIEITQCAQEGEECFSGVFTEGSQVKGICKTQKIYIIIELGRRDGNSTGEKIQHPNNNISVGCYCHLQRDEEITK